jgi:NAD(P)-dependent dehydrogenase (short-subunit alcohol dehydrogenase family)
MLYAKNWLITGCSRGLGRALAEAVVACRDNLVATARKRRDLEDLAAQVGERIITLSRDVTDYRGACEAVTAAVGTFSRLDEAVAIAQRRGLMAEEGEQETSS